MAPQGPHALLLFAFTLVMQNQKTLFCFGVKRQAVCSTVAQGLTNENVITLDDLQSHSDSKKKRGRTARVATVKKWNCEWLDYEEKDGVVNKIWCKYTIGNVNTGTVDITNSESDSDSSSSSSSFEGFTSQDMCTT